MHIGQGGPLCGVTMFSYVSNLTRKSLLIAGAAGALLGGFSLPVLADVTIDPITWNVIGLDSNKPATAQPAPGVYPPDRFPAGIEVCNGGGTAISGYQVEFVWDEIPSPNYLHLWDSSVNWNDGNASVGDVEATNIQKVPDLDAGACVDIYFWIQIEQVDAAYDVTRNFHVELSDGTNVVAETPNKNNPVGGTTEEDRELYVEYLVSQNRNAVLNYQINDEPLVAADGTGSISVARGQIFDLTLYGQTATQGYEQIEAFLTLPPDLFDVTEVQATYSSAAGSDPNALSQLYADGCGWINDPDRAGYHESSSTCTSVGKYGGKITKKYKVRVRETLYDATGAASTAGKSFVAQSLIYDFSGSSYHYNADLQSSSLEFKIEEPGENGAPTIPAFDASIVKTGSYNGGSNSGVWIISVKRETDLCSGTTNCSEFGPITVIDKLPAGYELKGTNNTVREAPDLSSELTYFDAQGSEIPFGDEPRSFKWGPITLPAGTDSVDLEIDFRSSGAEIVSDEDITNCAKIESDKDTTNNESCIVTVDTDATSSFDLGVRKSVSGVEAGANNSITVTFRIDVTAVSGTSTADVTVRDVLPAGYTFLSAGSAAGGLSFVSHSSGVILMTYQAGSASGSFTFTATAVLPGASDSIATIESNYINAVQLTDLSGNLLNDANTGNNRATAAYVPPLLNVDKSPASSSLSGSTPSDINYDITVQKLAGFTTGNTIKLTEAPPPGLRFTAISEADSGTSWTCTVDGSAITFPTASTVECSRTVADGEATPLTYPVLTFTAGLDPVPTANRVLVNSVFVEGYDGNTPIPNTFDDDDAVITYTTQDPKVDLELDKAASTGTPQTGSEVTYTLTVLNKGPDTATNIQVADALPTGLSYAASSISGGDVRDASDTDYLQWTINSLAKDASVQLSYRAEVQSSGSYKNVAEVIAVDQTDTDSVTADDGDQSEDDEDAVTVDPFTVQAGQVSLSGIVFKEVSDAYDGLKTTEQTTNAGGGLYVCIDTTPARYAAVGSPSTGAFTFAGLDPSTTYQLVLTTASSGTTCPTASTLNTNWFSTGESADGSTTDSVVTPGESLSDGKLTVAVGTTDFTTATFGVVQADVFDPPFGLKTGEFLDGQPVIRWTMVWINDSPIPVSDAVITDPPPTGTTYVNGSISCEGRGITTVTTCEFDVTGNSVNVVADFGPETGSPTDEDTAANELLIVFDVTYDAANPEPEYANQGTLSWDPGSGAKTASTDDPTAPGASDPAVVVPAAPAPPAATPVPINPWQFLLALMMLLSWLSYAQLRTART